MFSAIVFHCWTAFPGGRVGAACDTVHAIITIASATKIPGMDSLPCIPPNVMSNFLNLYISISPFGNGTPLLLGLFYVAEMRMAAPFLGEPGGEIAQWVLARVSQW